MCYILSKYQRRARTRHQTLSSDTEENEERQGRKDPHKRGTMKLIFSKEKPPSKRVEPRKFPSECGRDPLIAPGRYSLNDQKKSNQKTTQLRCEMVQRG